MNTPWKVLCGDIFGRSRAITVRIAEDRVVLGLPPGESAAFTDDQLGQLSRILDVADTGFRLDALRRRRLAQLRGES